MRRSQVASFVATAGHFFPFVPLVAHQLLSSMPVARETRDVAEGFPAPGILSSLGWTSQVSPPAPPGYSGAVLAQDLSGELPLDDREQIPVVVAQDQVELLDLLLRIRQTEAGRSPGR